MFRNIVNCHNKVKTYYNELDDLEVEGFLFFLIVFLLFSFRRLIKTEYQKVLELTR